MRSSLRRIARRTRRFWEDLWLSRSPRKVSLQDLTSDPIAFTVHSSVERYRIMNYGGEREVLQRFLGTLRPEDIVFDIGASVGLYTIAGATRLDRGWVYAFEPDPNTRTRLEENIRLNRLENVQTIPWAVSDREGRAALFTEGPSGYASTLTRQQRKGAPKRHVTIPTRTLDRAIDTGDLPVPDVIKLDVEGAEGLCVRGSLQLLQGGFGKRPREIFLELHPEFLISFQESAAEIRYQITCLGYIPCWSMERSNQQHIHYIDPSEGAPATG